MDSRLIQPFIESTKTILFEMTGIEITSVGDPIVDSSAMRSNGVSSAITFSGKLKGRFVIDMPPEMAKVVVGNMMGEPVDNVRDRLFLSGISEMNNIIAGDANTTLNNAYSLSLRLAPPIVFTGTNVMVASSNIECVTIECVTAVGHLKLNVAFQGGIIE